MKHHMKVWRLDGRTTDITIRLMSDDERTEVTISRGLCDLGKTMVNWPGCGAQDMAATYDFHQMIRRALNIAERLDGHDDASFEGLTNDEVEGIIEESMEMQVVY